MNTVEIVGKSAARTNGVTGILIDKVDGKRLVRVLKDRGVQFDATMTTEQRVVALRCDFEQKTADRSRLVRCKSCKGVADEDYGDACPYCGSTEACESYVGPPTAMLPPQPQPLVQVDAPRKSEQPKVAIHRDQKLEDTAQAAALPAPKKAKKGDTMLLAGMDSTTEANGAIEHAPVTEHDLDTAVADVKRLKNEATQDYWRCGLKIAEIRDSNLWKQRLRDGKPVYKSWDSFVHTELFMTPAHANRWAAVGREFTAKEVSAWGVTKCALLLELPPELRKGAKARVDAGITASQLSTEIKQTKGDYVRPSKNKATAAAALAGGKARHTQKAEATKREKGLTVANALGSVQIKLFRKPTDTKKIDWKKLTRAGKLGDRPFGREELTNGVVRYYEVLPSAGGELMLKVKTVRE